jgi:hypothetical protein
MRWALEGCTAVRRGLPAGLALGVRGVRHAAFVLAAVALACTGETSAPGPAPAPSEWRSFQGSWSATGERHTLNLGADRRASVLNLSGSLLLTGERGIGVGFRASAIVFSDSATGSVGRCVWTDERGDQIFSELTGGVVAGGRQIFGTITGGTGRWTGVSGEYRFGWEYVIEAEEGRVQGRAIGLEGRARIAAAAPGAGPR